MPLYPRPQHNSSRTKRSGANTAPVNFDPATHPIIARHWFGIEPPRSTCPTAAEVASNLRRHRQFEHVHRLGPRAIEELAVEVANGEDLDSALEAYQRLTPEMLEATGGDHFPARPIHMVRP